MRSRPPAAPAWVAFAATAADATPVSDASLMSLAVSEPFLTLAPVTALGRNCLDPTLFAGRRVTAYELPPMATNSARKATAIAGDGQTRARLIRIPPSSIPTLAYGVEPRRIRTSASGPWVAHASDPRCVT